jgi:hypothetical protein
MFAMEEVPLLGLAMQQAYEVTGIRTDPHRPDEQTDRIIARSINAFRSLRIAKIPTLLLPKAAVPGEFQSIAELRTVLTDELIK